MISWLVSGHGTHGVGDGSTDLTGIGEIAFEVLRFNMHFHIVLPFVRKIIANTTAVFAGIISPLYQHYELFEVDRRHKLTTWKYQPTIVKIFPQPSWELEVK